MLKSEPGAADKPMSMFWNVWKRDKNVPVPAKAPDRAAASQARSDGAAGSSEAPKLQTLAGEPLVRVVRPKVLVWSRSVAEADLLRVKLRLLTMKYELHFGSSGDDIRRLAGAEGCDGVIVPIGSETGPEIDFLKEVVVFRPGVFRLVRSAERIHLQVLGKDPYTHHVPLDPEPEIWESILDRCVVMRTWMETPELKTLVGRMKKLPALPNVYTRVVDELNSPEASLSKVAEIVSEDPVVTAKMLQLVNSSFFGLHQQIVNAADAVMFLGADRVKGLILVARVFSQFDPKIIVALGLDQLWNHSMKTGAYAQSIAKSEVKDARAAGAAFTAGLLHDVGKLMLAGNLPEEYLQVLDVSRREKIPVNVAEKRAFGATHAELGGVLMGLWGLPLELIQSVGWHHSPGLSGDRRFSVLTAVHAANAIASDNPENASRSSGLDTEYLSGIGMQDRRNQWRKVCGLDPVPDDENAGRSRR